MKPAPQPRDWHCIAANRGGWGVLVLVEGREVLFLPNALLDGFVQAMTKAGDAAKGRHAAQARP